MTEIRFDVDLDHPPERVWRALTDPRQLGEWFLPIDVDRTDANKLRMRPSGLDGLNGILDARVMAAEAPSRLVMRWQGEDLHVRVVISIAETVDGSRLTFVQRGFLGRRGTLRRRILRTTYGRVFAERLPRALDRFAGQEPTVLLSARIPPPPTSANASSASRGGIPADRRNDGGFRGRRVRRAELRPVAAAAPEAPEAVRRGRHSAPDPTDSPVPPQLRPASPDVDAVLAIPRQLGPAHRAPESADAAAARSGTAAPGAAAVPSTVAAPGAAAGSSTTADPDAAAAHAGATATAAAAPGSAAAGRAAVPSASAWMAAQPAGRRHRAVAVPYRRGGGHRSIRRFVAVRPVADEPVRPLHAAGGRRRRVVNSHSARPSGRRRLIAWLRPGRPDWTPERRSRAAAISAALLLVFAVSAVVAARMATPPKADPPQVGGAAQPPPGFAVAPGLPGDPGGVGRLSSGSPVATPSAPAGSTATDNPSTPVAPSAVPAPTAGTSGLAASYRTAQRWIGGYRGEVTIDNRGGTAADGWTVSVTLPLLGLAVSDTHGAEFRQSGRTVTFTPTGDTRAVGASGSVRFDFAVNGVGEPTGCTVNGAGCAGIPG